MRAATRVGNYRAFTAQTGGLQNASFIGIDRVDFADVAFWRKDFAPPVLGG